MKVVLFCGGLGLRIREYSNRIPKPMVPIGNQPILWHVMRYYAHFGHREFILCLGYQGDVIKNYFLNRFDALSSNFTLSDGGKNIELLESEIQDWKITFVDTGASANVGMRLRAVQPYIGEDEVFLANYSDGLTDFDLNQLTEDFQASGAVASFLCVRPVHSFHIVTMGGGSEVTSIQHIAHSPVRINGGYFVFSREIFDYIEDGEELVEEPFQRLIRQHRLSAEVYNGYWACMDTLRDKQILDDLYARGEAPWEVWRQGAYASNRV